MERTGDDPFFKFIPFRIFQVSYSKNAVDSIVRVTNMTRKLVYLRKSEVVTFRLYLITPNQCFQD